MRQTEEALVAERLARQTAEAAQQTVGTQPAGTERASGVSSLVDTKARGKPPTFSGDTDSHGQPEGMTGSQWSFIFRSYLEAFHPAATGLLQQVEATVVDPAVIDNATMTESERRLSMQLFYVLALSCRGKDAAGGATSSRRFRIQDLEAAVQRVRAPSSITIPKHAPSPPVNDGERTTQCRQSIKGKAQSKLTRSSRETVCRRTSSWRSLQRHMCDGEPARHLNLQSGRLATYVLNRKEAVNFLRAKQTWIATGTADTIRRVAARQRQGRQEG